MHELKFLANSHVVFRKKNLKIEIETAEKR